jgi:hypothetical protein
MKAIKLTLTPSHEKALRITKEKDTEAFEAFNALGNEKAKLERKLVALDAEVADMERAIDVCDDDGALRIAAKRVQRQRVASRLEEIEEDIEKALNKILERAPITARTIETALEPHFEAQFDEVVMSIRPFCDNEIQAREFVESLSYFQQQSRFGNAFNIPNLNSAKFAFDCVEKLLRGEVPFQFEPEGNPNNNATRASMYSRVARVPVG